ncbi:CBS domain pair protein [Synechococcus sp. PCC 7335]|uniref:CBS domain-containing protein n=1 Tax=Synechococcus sp. (strain ATCC 29403 / PCC 7335) TaxID=91464 RepID=UPI00017EB8F5|nr:CBS domain-containing protein [Synechococcus sp. PCC 7335]EDX83560.1 CBS domain pair protein [Synechococcus sp. PCC 7335]
MQKKKVRSLIVEKAVQGGAYGIITERDIVYGLTAKSTDPTEVMVCEIMKSPCIVVEPNLSLPTVANRFLDAGIQRAPVIENGRLLSVVSVTDIIMNSNIEAVELPSDLSEQIEVALRHRRLGWNDDNQIEKESEVALEVLEELQ